MKTTWAICNALTHEPLTLSLAKFRTEQLARRKLRELTERGAVSFNQYRQAQWLKAIGERVHIGPPPYTGP